MQVKTVADGQREIHAAFSQLRGKPYLLVLDDVWRGDDLFRGFPDPAVQSSCHLVTTRARKLKPGGKEFHYGPQSNSPKAIAMLASYAAEDPGVTQVPPGCAVRLPCATQGE
jgi:hypothetical protein